MIIVTINNDLTAMEGVTEVPFKFEYDSASGKYGYRDGADTFRPFNDGSEPVLLWTNPSPTSAYGGGTIEIGNYPYIIIELKGYATETSSGITTVIIDKNKTTSEGVYVSAYSNTIGDSYTRFIRLNSTNIVFSTLAYPVGSSSSYISSATIPTRVWGCESAIPSGNSIQIPKFSFQYTSSRAEYPKNVHTDLTFNNMNRYTNISIASINSANTVTFVLIGDGSIIYQTSGSSIQNVSCDFSNISTLQIRLLVGAITIPGTTTDYTLCEAIDIVIS